MTTDLLEVQIQASLEGWAARVNVLPGAGEATAGAGSVGTPPLPAFPPPPPVAIWRRRPLVVSAALAAGVAMAAALVAIPRGTSVRTAGQPGGEAGQRSVPAAVGGAPLILLNDPAWQVAYFTTGPGGYGSSYTEYQFSGPASGHLQISFYATDSRTGPISSIPPTPSAASSVGGVIDVRGTQAAETNEVPQRWRLDWDESGVEWEADGTPFATAQDLAAFLAKVRVVDATTWQAQMPAGLVDDLRTHPADDVTWYQGQDITCRSPGVRGAVSPSDPTSTPTPCSKVPSTDPAPSPSPVASPPPRPESQTALPYCSVGAQPITPGSPLAADPGPLHCFATQDEENQYLLAQNQAVPNPIPTHPYSFTFSPDPRHSHCGGKLDVCFASTQQLADYAAQGMILSVQNGHASHAPIVVPTDTVRPATPVPTPG